MAIRKVRLSLEAEAAELGRAATTASRLLIVWTCVWHLHASVHLERLNRDHLVEISAHGFDAVEVFATTGHFDYHDKAAAASLGEWLADAGLTLSSLHGPIAASYSGGRWREPFNLAAPDEAARRVAVAEARAALEVAAVVPYHLLVIHAGVVGEGRAVPDNRKSSIVRSLEELVPVASDAGVRLAVEVIPNALSGPSALVGDDRRRTRPARPWRLHGRRPRAPDG